MSQGWGVPWRVWQRVDVSLWWRCSTMRYLQRLQSMMNDGDEQSTERFNRVLQHVMAVNVQLLEPDLLKDALSFLTGAASWLDTRWRGASDEEEVRRLCEAMPEHLVTDIVEPPCFLANMAPRILAATPLQELFAFCVTALSHPARIHSPHLRAKFGDVLFTVFLPPEEHYDYSARHHPHDVPHNAPHTAFLLTSPEAQEHLAPSLLLLYGDVEQTGYYDKLSHRIHIATVLKYLWKSPEHRSTFRRISKDTEGFVRFANGLMNETNTAVASAMKDLVEIRTFELRRAGKKTGQQQQQRGEGREAGRQGPLESGRMIGRRRAEQQVDLLMRTNGPSYLRVCAASRQMRRGGRR